MIYGAPATLFALLQTTYTVPPWEEDVFDINIHEPRAVDDFDAIGKKTGYTPPEGYNGFQPNKKKGKQRRY